MLKLFLCSMAKLQCWREGQLNKEGTKESRLTILICKKKCKFKSLRMYQEHNLKEASKLLNTTKKQNKSI